MTLKVLLYVMRSNATLSGLLTENLTADETLAARDRTTDVSLYC